MRQSAGCILLSLLLSSGCIGTTDPALLCALDSDCEAPLVCAQGTCQAPIFSDCPDGDADTICDAYDRCALGDDRNDLDADGIPDSCDPCPFDFYDDSDGDGICDGEDTCPQGSDAADGDGDGVADACDLCAEGSDTADKDGDGFPDACDPCPDDNPDDTDGDGICDSIDDCDGDNAQDADGDGIADACDVCPIDRLNDSDSDTICDSQDICLAGDDQVDPDRDGVPSACDPCPNDNPNDSDGDGICDSDDSCPNHADMGTDSDGDTVDDACDVCSGDDTVDPDGDGIPTSCDVCPFDRYNDSDADAVCDSVDQCLLGDDAIDPDGDGVPSACDICPSDFENDHDGDGICYGLDACKLGDDRVDTDTDGWADACDNCPGVSNSDQANEDADNQGDACDNDADNDGVPNDADACPQGVSGWTSDVSSDHDDDGCKDDHAEDPDDDHDGVLDGSDDCEKGAVNWDANGGSDFDQDGCEAAEDPDDDNDQRLDGGDSNDADPRVCSDTDGDTCDDCSTGTFSASNDGPDLDEDGLCDQGDTDLDNDGILNDPDKCDGFGAQLSWTSTSNTDFDQDGCKDDSGEDTDDDNDGRGDSDDPDDRNKNVCGDSDSDTCDDCSQGGTFDVAEDGPDLDHDGACDAGDSDQDGDARANDNDSHPRDGSLCADTDFDGCDDCSVDSFSIANDGPDADKDGKCDAGDDGFTIYYIDHPSPSKDWTMSPKHLPEDVARQRGVCEGLTRAPTYKMAEYKASRSQVYYRVSYEDTRERVLPSSALIVSPQIELPNLQANERLWVRQSHEYDLDSWIDCQPSGDAGVNSDAIRFFISPAALNNLSQEEWAEVAANATWELGVKQDKAILDSGHSFVHDPEGGYPTLTQRYADQRYTDDNHGNIRNACRVVDYTEDPAMKDVPAFTATQSGMSMESTWDISSYEGMAIGAWWRLDFDDFNCQYWRTSESRTGWVLGPFEVLKTTCGNGLKEVGEACDDGNTDDFSSTDFCGSDCRVSRQLDWGGQSPLSATDELFCGQISGVDAVADGVLLQTHGSTKGICLLCKTVPENDADNPRYEVRAQSGLNCDVNDFETTSTGPRCGENASSLGLKQKVMIGHRVWIESNRLREVGALCQNTAKLEYVWDWKKTGSNTPPAQSDTCEGGGIIRGVEINREGNEVYGMRGLCYTLCVAGQVPDSCGVCGGFGPSTWYFDNDGDGLGGDGSSLSCVKPDRYVSNSDDPDDFCETNNNVGCGCGVPKVTRYSDSDLDGKGDPNTSEQQCQNSSLVNWVLDNTDNCPTTSNALQENHDGDSQGDVCDQDDDNDGVLDGSDSCKLGTVNWDATGGSDPDGDGCENGEDGDDDNDGVVDGSDSKQTNANACKDSDGDGCDDCSLTGADKSGGSTSNDGADFDGDGLCDAGDPDDDNDGRNDTDDGCVRGNKDWTSTVFSDFDYDGCQDSSEDAFVGCPSSSSAQTTIYNTVITWLSSGPSTGNNGTSSAGGCTGCHGDAAVFSDNTYYHTRFYGMLMGTGPGVASNGQMPQGCTPGVNCWHGDDALFVKRWVDCGAHHN
ncbi:MAG: thrombospondin type 3 repeat-containing protein [Myxococcota bacterium]|nr:thrombospondin type 3 repeat-containing protein [Myxococcota bacterium]